MAVICSSRRFLININSHPVHSVFWQVIRSEGMAKHTDLQILNNLITGLFSVWSCISYEFSRQHQCGPVTEAVSGASSSGCSAGGRAGCSGLLPQTIWFKWKPNIQLMWVTLYTEDPLRLLSLQQMPSWEKLTNNWKQKVATQKEEYLKFQVSSPTKKLALSQIYRAILRNSTHDKLSSFLF